jgi:glycosyltransferase involved in cell wall biosynthesis
MLAATDFLVARALPGLLPVRDARGAIRVLIASLAHGGAERIVLEWLAAEASRGRDIELAVLHARRPAWPAPGGVHARVRGRESVDAFLRALARDWRGAIEPVSTHLVGDGDLAILWAAGIQTVPVMHNARDGWRNDPASWRVECVPAAIACAQSVRDEMLEAGCRVPVVALRHRPAVGPGAFDPAMREEIRAALGVGPSTFLVGAVGALKAQKDYPRAVEVLARLCARRDAALAIIGGALDAAGVAELGRIAATAAAHGVASRLKLPGFVDPVESYYAAFDAVLNVSRFEGLSIAAQEALAAGLPVVATDVGGQREIAHARLSIVDVDASAGEFVECLVRLPVRTQLSHEPSPRAPRAWSLTLASRHFSADALETLFVTANLNAGGAQRSLVNLAHALRHRHAFAVAVCGDCTHPAFSQALCGAGIEAFSPAPETDCIALSESVLAHAAGRGARNLCFWNVDAKVKLLVAKFAPPALRLIDVSPGHYAVEELGAAADFADAIAFSADDYYRRLDVLVLKYDARDHPAARRVERIPNGVAAIDVRRREPAAPRFLVSGRLAPSKRLESILEAFALVHARHPAAELHFVGQAEERHADYAENLALRAAALPVRFRGAMPDLAHLSEPFTAAIVIGTHQGSPNAVLEAMAAGIPVIANASGGTGEMIRNGHTGWLLSCDANAGEIVRALEESIRDTHAGARFADRAREFVRRHHRMDDMADRYLAILEDPSRVERAA